MMKPNVKRRPRTRSSKQTCEEKFCCPFIDCEAKYFCDDCKSAQCQACEKSIHKTKVKYDFHYRKPLPVVAEASLCQAKKLNLACKDKNYPDLWCEQCKIQLCFTCFDKYHSSEKRRQHINVSMAHHLKKQQEQQQQANVDVELYESLELYQDALSDMIKPQAPFSLADESDSVTFCSFPQESDSAENEIQFTSASIQFPSDQSNTNTPYLQNKAEFMNTPRTIANLDVQELARSFLLIDDLNTLQVTEETAFIDKLGCDRGDTFKLLSVLGSTRDWHSQALNHILFRDQEIIKTSISHSATTAGISCSLSKDHRVLALDAGGLQCSLASENHLTCHLLKVLAVSDIVIYCMKAEHQHKDLPGFLTNATKDYLKHFRQELQFASQQYGVSLSDLCPTFIVLHETLRPETFEDVSENGLLQQVVKSEDNLVEVSLKIFHVGIHTVQATDFSGLQHCVTTQINDMSVRIPRRLNVIFQSLKALNDKFGQEIETLQINVFPKEYFACTIRCLACNAQCKLSSCHDTEAEPHDPGGDKPCQYHISYGNKVFMCKTCLMNNKQSMVVPKTSSSSDNSWIGLTKYIWSGYVYECLTCGVICRSREHWYGNEDETESLHVEFRHVWPRGPSGLDGTHNAARKVLESFHTVADTISSVGASPVKYLAEWTADKISPSYWMPNSEIIKCSSCQRIFDNTEQKHHCRACGKGFCAECSSKKRAVPERGWGLEPVRVCDTCYNKSNEEMDTDVTVEQAALTARKVGEVVTSTFGAVISALDYPIGVIKKSAKPTYWVPDDNITECFICQKTFGPRLSIHHCRACGQGVCKDCSPNKCCVPLRGWDYPVRVCSKCEKKKDKI